MRIQKTVKAKVIDPTHRKQDILEKEYQNFQGALHGEEVDLYSATRQQAERLLKKIKVPKHRHYPLILRRDVIKLERQDTDVAPYWFKFPCFGVRGGIWLALKPHCDIPDDCSLREAKLIKRKNARSGAKGCPFDSWFIHLTIERPVCVQRTGREVDKPAIHPDRFLAIDLGERYLAVVCGDNGIQPRFLGKEARGIRRHYAWLRKRLGERRLLSIIKKVGNTEKRKVDAVCHRISRQIVNEAKQTGSTIVLGDLKGIRQRAKGKKMNRIVSSMPYYKLTQFIKYKAVWEGIPVLVIPEAYTSKTCHQCGSIGSRPYQGLFLCHCCGLHYSADLNGARNILKRAVGYIPSAGASLPVRRTQTGLTVPITQSPN